MRHGVTIRLFAAAREAAGTSEVRLPSGQFGELMTKLLDEHPPLEAVMAKCSVLVDGTRTTDLDLEVPAGATVDILPPFAGG